MTIQKSIFKLSSLAEAVKPKDRTFYHKMIPVINGGATGQLSNQEITSILKVLTKEYNETVKRLKSVQSQQ